MKIRPTKKLQWEAWRIIPSRNPPIDLYRRVAPPGDWASVISVELMTNPRVREMREGLGLVRPEDLKGGATQNWILAPFTYLNPEGNQFCDGTFGTCFQAQHFEIALTESIRLRQNFLHRTSEAAVRLDMRVLKTQLHGEFDDATKLDPFDNDDARKKYWKARRQEGCDGAFFLSADVSEGQCVEVFRPRVMSNAVQERHLSYLWDGQRISEAYDFAQGKSIDLDHLRKTGKIRYVEKEPAGRNYATR